MDQNKESPRSYQSIISWFPGHMAKAKREIMEKIKQVDLILELKDARIPYSSTNPLIDEIIGSKPRLILLCKSKMADPAITELWIRYYNERHILALDIDSLAGYHLSSIKKYCEMALKEVFDKRKKKGIVSKSVKAMILGIPNVGKSTLINALAHRKATVTGDKPGVTKSQTWIKIDADFFIMDTPGILWPKFEDPSVGVKLALCGSIKDQILNLEEIVLAGIAYLKEHYPALLLKRYGIDGTHLTADEILDRIALKRGYLLKGGLPDRQRTYTMVINELRTVKIGAISYERPEESEFVSI